MEYPVEIKANVEPSTIDSALNTFGLADAEAEHRSIYFLETSSRTQRLELYVQSAILRVRHGDDGADCTLKFRPCDIDKLPEAWKLTPQGPGWEFRIEQDWSGHVPSLSASLEVDVDNSVAKTAIANWDPAALVSADQRGLFGAYAAHQLEIARLVPLGPIHARKWKIKRDTTINGTPVGHKINVEEWVVGDDLRFLELSGREDDMVTATQTRRELNELYGSLKLSISATQQLKTKLVLDHFS